MSAPQVQTTITSHPITVLLVDDQVIIAEAIRRMLDTEPDILLHFCQDPSKALQMAVEVNPTVILQDLVMPGVDGLTLVRYFRANPGTSNVPLIVLSTKEEPKIKAEAFSLGANDYLVKLPDRVELIARIRYHSKSYIRLLQRNEAYEKLHESQKVLHAELAEAAEYVKTLLPEPLTGPIKADWRFVPSTLLGGDAFGYHWLDEDHFVLFLLDVCGHGVGAALLSIAIMSVLSNEALAHVNFLDPADVLKGLNEAFPMEKHNNMFFTMWYGVFEKSSRKLIFSNGGHPPAILVVPHDKSQQLTTPGLVVGGMPKSDYENAETKIPSGSKLFLFSDGVYEITQADGKLFTLDHFIKLIEESSVEKQDLEKIFAFSKTINGPQIFSDDYSLVRFVFD